ncbi:trichodiene synthase [Boeremia exigua]|uniref:trichodiene synthase n=1 Tax=Boeremia exigua TaxID=749465 RepID=UPI001E8D13F6|nr:trichodiene synthase [Boeremia exigua]KAH6622421.1 trichodiene synthase [Boeremia exigua]
MTAEAPTWSLAENVSLGTDDFPTDFYLDAVVRFLKVMKYDDNNYTHEERVHNLHYAYAKAARHFAQPKQQQLIKAHPKRLQASLQTIVAMVVYAWVRVDCEVMADLSIHYTYMLLLDDSDDHPEKTMDTFYDDLLAGRPQQHSWWQMVNEQFPTLLQHYGPYCKLNLVRSTTDFFQGCWIEQHNFQGYPGSYDFPGFLRRMNGLGHCVGASIFPKKQFTETTHFKEITSAIAQMENWMVFVNDLLSFFKEWDEPRDQASLVNNYAICDRTSLLEALEKLTRDCIRDSEQIVEVFADKHEDIKETLTLFCQGYITWHLSDPRYRLDELTAKVSGSASTTADEFRRYQESARRVGAVNPEEWAFPSVVELVEQRKTRRDSIGKVSTASSPELKAQ